MSDLEDRRAMFTMANEILAAHGLREDRVYVVVEVYTAPIGTDGAVIAVGASSEFEIPNVSVSKPSSSTAQTIAARVPSVVTANGLVPMLALQDIPRAYTGGGFTLASLLEPATASTTTRCLFRVVSEEHGAYPGTLFEVVDFNADDAHVLSIYVKPAQVFPS